MTTLPYRAIKDLGNYKTSIPSSTRTIVLMGAGGFPSESLLMRLWYTAKLGKQYPDADIVITTPGDTLDMQSTISLMRRALLDTGIDSVRLILENEGLNTRHQAIKLEEKFERGIINEPMVVVSSPEHIYRSVKCFEKVGFRQVFGLPATDVMLETDLRIASKRLGGKRIIPDLGTSILIRYKFWDNLKFEIIVLREYLAIFYYWLSGWI